MDATLPREPNSAERRLLSVVFSDLVGSTRLSQLLDPEDMRDLLAAYQGECVAIVERHRGHVAQFLGDGILIYFGYPVAHEDDARRAVAAALDIAEHIPRLTARSSTAPLKVRVGVHTGLTVVGTVGSGERRENLAVGGAPNVAASVQHIAEPNTVAITDTTKRLVQGFFRCERLEHGFQAIHGPMELYRVVGRTGASRSIDAATALGLTQFVGRADEVATVQALWLRILQGDAHAVLLEGEPGIGKSRLVQVIKEQITNAPARIVEWHCGPDFQSTALRPVAQGIERELRLAEDVSSPERLEKLERWLQDLSLFSSEAVKLMGSLLSIPTAERHGQLESTPQRIRRRTLEIIVDVVRALSAREPLLLIVEDLHWADPTTLELIGLLLDRLETSRLLILLTSRSKFEPPREAAPRFSRKDLPHLCRSDVEHMVSELAQGRELPAQVLSEIAARSDGVPLFVEALTHAVLESGVLTPTGTRYELARTLDPSHIPLSLKASLTARLDRLGATKRLAQVASVLGQSFSYDMLRHTEDSREEDLRGDLASLIKADLIQVTGEPPEAHYAFKHALIRDEAYASLLFKVRRELHRRIAQILVSRSKDNVHAQSELIAHHFTHAEAPLDALPYWITAGQQALSRFANHEALTCLRRGLEALEKLSEGEARANAELTMRVLLGPALMATKGYSHSDVLANYTRAHELVGQVGATPQMFGILWGLWAQYFVGGQLLAARDPAEQVVRMARLSGDPKLVPPAHHALGFVECYTAHYPETIKLVEEGLAVFDPERERENILTFQFSSSLALMNMGATAYWMVGKPNRARELAARSIPLAQRLGHSPSMAFAITSSAWILQLAGDAQQVKETAEFVRKISEEEGFDFWPPLVNVFGGWAQMAAGDIDGGAEMMLKSFAEYRAIGGGILRTHGFALLGEGLLTAGRIDDALATVEEAIESAHSSGEAHFEPELHRVKGLALERRGGPGSSDAARASLQHGLELARQQGARWLELKSAISLSRFLRQDGDRQRAYATLAPVYAAIDEGHDTAEMKDAAALLQDLER